MLELVGGALGGVLVYRFLRWALSGLKPLTANLITVLLLVISGIFVGTGGAIGGAIAGVVMFVLSLRKKDEITGTPAGSVAIPSGARTSAPLDIARPPAQEKKCPDCGELVKAEARICRFCRYEFRPVSES